MEIAIVKYPAGNIASLQYTLERLGVKSIVTDDQGLLNSAEKVIFPGQGAAGPAMKSLRESGLDKVLLSLTQPFLGICLGLQLMADYSEEDNTDCLGLFPTKVVRFTNDLKKDHKIPHMSWNRLSNVKENVLTQGISEHSWFYFVHSYYMPPIEQTLGLCSYTQDFTAIASHKNYYAVQFHPEKSAKDGEKLLTNFLFEL